MKTEECGSKVKKENPPPPLRLFDIIMFNNEIFSGDEISRDVREF